MHGAPYPGAYGDTWCDDENGEEDDGDGDYECRVCGHRTDIETPQLRAEAWCQGECDTFRIFKRRE